ncbi:hypothetical protein VTN77DRAFT_9854 [Rasamsonia byssochlamydoides]|uniref:uncharacterized protein n=1 Tax=Rasamsonia byssochlamydoides TaxID=89139 RepID=UPI00374268AF
MHLQIEVVSAECVWPSTRPDSPVSAPLSIIDATVADFSPCQAVILFDANHDPNTSSRLTPDYLRSALQKTLEAYPQWCGRLHQSTYQPGTVPKSHTLRYGRLFLTYGRSDDPGALFIVAKADRPLAELVPSGQESATRDARTWNAANFPAAQLVSQAQLSTKNLDDPSLPSVVVQVTTFSCGGVAVALKFAHLLADAHCMALFAQDWAAVSHALLAGTELPHLSPLFDPQSLDKHAAGNIDAPHPDSQLVAQAHSLPSHRYDWWISHHDCPYETRTKHIPMELPMVPHDPPGQRMSWSEWDVTAPVSHYVLHFSRNELDRLWKDVSAAASIPLSRQDALLAHLWSCINRARSPIFIAAISTTGREAATGHPSKLASLIRSTVAVFTPENVAAHLHAKAYEQNPVRIWEAILGRRHLLVTSWVHTGMHRVDFGTDTPRYVQGAGSQDRRPVARHGSAHGVDVQLYLATESMDRLLQNPAVRKYSD